MKLKLKFGEAIKEYEIGSSQSAKQAIARYTRYLQKKEHADVYWMNDALMGVLQDLTTPTPIKMTVCTAISEYNLYMASALRKTDLAKAVYFAHASVGGFDLLGLPQPGENSRLLGEMQADVQLAINNGKLTLNQLMEAGIAVGEVDDPVPPAPQAARSNEALLKDYTAKFFKKRDEVQPASHWKPYAKDLIQIESRKGHDIRFMNLGVGKDELAKQCVARLKHHGFWAQLTSAKNGAFVSVDLTDAAPRFKKPL